MSTGTRPDVELVVPVHNEQAVLEESVRRLVSSLERDAWFSWHVTIADNASTDATAEIARRLAAELPPVDALVLPRKGRGYALKQAWGCSEARVLGYVDVDLSTDLRALAPLVAPLLSGHSEIGIGTRLDPAARVLRGAKREFISRGYNVLLRMTLGASFSDAQCGFKAVRADVAAALLPYVEDDGWFFDTELLVIAERAGLRIHEVPVDWVDDLDSRVDLRRTAIEDLRGMLRLGLALERDRIPLVELGAVLVERPTVQPADIGLLGQLVRFGAVGVASTVAFALVYLLFALLVPNQLADFLALLVTTVANTAANRRLTFGVRGRRRALVHQLQGLLVFGIAWAVTSTSLVVLGRFAPEAGALAEVAVLTFANLLATAIRFALLRLWVFRRETEEPLVGARLPSAARLPSDGRPLR
ncbi:MAG: bifunctional glycosyltransferase family 2/GtrA family protein [Microbacteriaceae bacterium]